MNGRRLTERQGDLLLAAITAVLFTVQIGSEQQFAGKGAGALALALVFSATLAWRRRRPLVPLVAGVALIEASNPVSPPVCARDLLGRAAHERPRDARRERHAGRRVPAGRDRARCTVQPL